MEPYPHRYAVRAGGAPEGSVALESQGLPSLSSAAPAEFGGPGDQWSPETLLVAAVADCFILTFRAIATASKFAWGRVECRAEGVVDRRDGKPQFTELRLHATLTVPEGANVERAERLLEKAEQTCLVTNSLKATPTLTVEISYL
ncbi:MAG TPA: OsmC family protein [Gammaproteobacteria bacterium]|nr:OsmC family protein [Gammaproteobacteria bacterium]